MMKEYHKIQTVYKRNPDTNYKTLIEGEFSKPEFEYLKDCDWEWTEKVDGTNIRIIFNLSTGVQQIKGKTDKAQVQPVLLEVLEKIFNIDKFDMVNELFNKIDDDTGDFVVCLYGEGYGNRINKGGKYRSDHGFVLFDARIGHWWLKRETLVEIADKLGLEIVPVIGRGTLLEMVEKVRAGFTSEWGNFQAEGIVARPAVDLMARNRSRIITKLKCKDFRK